VGERTGARYKERDSLSAGGETEVGERIVASGRARQLRRNATDAEIRLWSRLRRKQLAGFRFRRQHPLGSYIVDFFCPEARLIVEVDGGQHGEENAHDARRTEWLEARGYRVVRFWNNEVLSNTDGVLTTILVALGA
jgi:very-short-patch-repair endonuclease